MEKKTIVSLIIILIAMTFATCKKGLPVETQTGADTFGCFVNGQLFVPKGSLASGPIYDCYYQHIYPGESGFVFHVAGSNNRNSSNVYGININCDSIKIEQNKTYVLKGTSKSSFVGAYLIISDRMNEYVTTNTHTGELSIKKFDEVNNIVSGTFWFNAINSSGDTVKITDGRFDMRFTR